MDYETEIDALAHGGTTAHCDDCGAHLWKDEDGEFCLYCQPSADDYDDLSEEL
jgi:uncharacterized Zn finger protein (UPF0148 family)